MIIKTSLEELTHATSDVSSNIQSVNQCAVENNLRVGNIEKSAEEMELLAKEPQDMMALFTLKGEGTKDLAQSIHLEG